MSNTEGGRISATRDTFARLFGEGGRLRWIPYVAGAIYVGNLATVIVMTILASVPIVNEAAGVFMGALLLSFGPLAAFAIARRVLPESIQANPRWYVREGALFATVFLGHAAVFLGVLTYQTFSASFYQPGFGEFAAIGILSVVLTPLPTLAILGVRRWLL